MAEADEERLLRFYELLRQQSAAGPGHGLSRLMRLIHGGAGLARTMLSNAGRGADAELGEQGRELVRYCETQSLCRAMVEEPTQKATRRLARHLAENVRARIG
jgi:hypothetical protein